MHKCIKSVNLRALQVHDIVKKTSWMFGNEDCKEGCVCACACDEVGGCGGAADCA